MPSDRVAKEIMRDEELLQVNEDVNKLVNRIYANPRDVKRPYGLEHVRRVSDYARTSSQYFVALLHDAVEDGLCDWSDIAELNLNLREMEALELLTRNKEGQTYAEYIENIANSGNLVAIIVKINDIRDHLRPEDIDNLTPSHIKRYTKAHEQLLMALRKER